MSAFKTSWLAAALPDMQRVHGFDVTLTRATDAVTQTVKLYDPLGAQLGAVDVKSERNVFVAIQDLAWTPVVSDYFTPSDDSAKYTIEKVALRTNGMLRLQGWTPEVVT